MGPVKPSTRQAEPQPSLPRPTLKRIDEREVGMLAATPAERQPQRRRQVAPATTPAPEVVRVTREVSNVPRASRGLGKLTFLR